MPPSTPPTPTEILGDDTAAGEAAAAAAEAASRRRNPRRIVPALCHLILAKFPDLGPNHNDPTEVGPLGALWPEGRTITC